MFETARDTDALTQSSAGAEPAACVFLTCFLLEFDFLATLLRHTEMRLYHAETIEQADFLLTVTDSHVLLCNTVLPDGDWGDVAEMLGRAHPSVSLLILADTVDAPFVAGALQRGACAVTWKPIGLQMRHLIAAAGEAAAARMRPPG